MVFLRITSIVCREPENEELARKPLMYNDSPYLSGQLLVAMPGIGDPRFEKTVICICAHSEEGAMGLVVNRMIKNLTFPDMLAQLGIEALPSAQKIQVHFGGPVEAGRGFVLHSSDYTHEGTLKVDDSIALTATVDILRDMADGTGPKETLLALGYAGWGSGQLDKELSSNGWLSVPADKELVFSHDHDKKWDRAMAKIGIDPKMLSGDIGHA